MLSSKFQFSIFLNKKKRLDWPKLTLFKLTNYVTKKLLFSETVVINVSDMCVLYKVSLKVPVAQ